jgi:hypothetical protein
MILPRRREFGSTAIRVLVLALRCHGPRVPEAIYPRLEDIMSDPNWRPWEHEGQRHQWTRGGGPRRTQRDDEGAEAWGQH